MRGVMADQQTAYPYAIAPPVDSRRAKVAGMAAERIIADITDRGWPVGEILGSEAELIERYGISRAVFREAVRLVEHQHVARMRRGPGGGLVVEEPSVDAVISAMALYLLRVDATLDEVFDTRLVLEEIVAEAASERIDDDDVAAIHAVLAAEADTPGHDQRELHNQLAKATGNPVLDLFVETLNRVAQFYYNDPTGVSAPEFSQSLKAHAQIAKAVMDRNPGLARTRMRRHLLAEAQFVRDQAGSAQTLAPSVALVGATDSKRAESIARSIFADMLAEGLEPGEFVGSETGLMDKHGVSRSILREAIRILEYHRIALMRRGPHGGLFVAPPSAAAITDIVANYLRRRGVGHEQVAEVRVGIELAMIDRLAARPTADDAALLRGALDDETKLSPGYAFEHGRDLHAVLGSLAGNQVLELIQRVLLRLAGTLFERPAPSRTTRPTGEQLAEVQSAHRGIAEALIRGNHEDAARRLREHLGSPTLVTGH
jgi:DNA-binding FadR family transcriptional regulator